MQPGKRLARGARRALVVAAVIALFPIGFAAAQDTTDNMMPTPNASGSCQDLGTNPGNQVGTVCQTDNSSLYYYSQRGTSLSLEPDERVIARDVIRAKYDDATDLVVYFDDPPDYTGPSETDLIYQEGPVEAGYIGMYFCNDRAGFTNGCDQGYVRFANNWIDRGLACHETGHAVGLLHGRDAYYRLANNADVLACMKTPHDGTTALDGYNKNNINAQY